MISLSNRTLGGLFAAVVMAALPGLASAAPVVTKPALPTGESQNGIVRVQGGPNSDCDAMGTCGQYNLNELRRQYPGLRPEGRVTPPRQAERPPRQAERPPREWNRPRPQRPGWEHRRGENRRHFDRRYSRDYYRPGFRGGPIYIDPFYDDGYYVSPPPRYVAPAPRRVVRLSAAHVRWCKARYKSYRVSDNSWQPYNGPRRQCISPYS